MIEDALGSGMTPDANLAPDDIQKPNDMAAQIRRSAELKGYERGLKEAQAQSGPSLSAADIERITQESFDKRLNAMRAQSQEEANKRYAEQMEQKYQFGVQAGKSAYADYDEKVDSLGAFKDLPEIKLLAGESGDAAHFMYEIAQNPQKALSLAQMVQTELNRGQPPAVALQQAKQIAAAAKANLDAKANIDLKEPITQFKSSGTNAVIGKPTVEDLRLRDPRYRA